MRGEGERGGKDGGVVRYGGRVRPRGSHAAELEDLPASRCYLEERRWMEEGGKREERGRKGGEGEGKMSEGEGRGDGRGGRGGEGERERVRESDVMEEEE